MNNEPVAWMREDGVIAFHKQKEVDSQGFKWVSLYTHPADLTDEEIDSVIHELRQKSFDPERWVDVYTVAIETIIQLRNELSILRKAQEK